VIWDRPLALFLDVDGTLLDISRRPDEVLIPGDLPALLGAASTVLEGALALVSGRAIGDLDRLFAPLRLPAAGQHGTELRLDPGAEPARMPARPLSPALRKAAGAIAAAHPGVWLEDKGLTLALHFRESPAAGPPLRRALQRLVGESEGIALCRGKMVYELRDARITKGAAVEAFLEHPSFRNRLPIFIGDDVTDEDGFAAVERHGGIAMPVGDLAEGSPHADRCATFAGPAEVRRWLATLMSPPDAEVS